MQIHRHFLRTFNPDKKGAHPPTLPQALSTAMPIIPPPGTWAWNTYKNKATIHKITARKTSLLHLLTNISSNLQLFRPIFNFPFPLYTYFFLAPSLSLFGRPHTLCEIIDSTFTTVHYHLNTTLNHPPYRSLITYAHAQLQLVAESGSHEPRGPGDAGV